MNLLNICDSSDWSDLERQVLKISLEQEKHGCGVTLLCRAESILEKKARELPLTVVSFPDSRWRAPLKIARLLNSTDFAVIHAYSWTDLNHLSLAIKLNKWQGKLFYTHQTLFQERMTDTIWRRVVAPLNRVFAISHMHRQNLQANGPTLPCPVEVLPHSVDLQRFNPDFYRRLDIREALLLDPETLLISIFGEICPANGQLDFLKAAAIIKRKSRKKVMFLIVGAANPKNADYEKELHRQTLTELDLEQDIIWAGYRENTPELMKASDILMVPTHQTGNEMTVLAAMAMRLPVVAYNFAGIPDIMENHQTGLWVLPGDFDNLADAVIKLVHNQRLRQHYGLSGRIRVEQQFDLKNYIANLAKIYESDVPKSKLAEK